jgi:TonB family protein
MSDRNPCVNCHRSIDSLAKACPFCGWDQREVPIAREEPKVPAAAAASAPSAPRLPIDRRILGALGIAALLILVFLIGALVHGRQPAETPSPTSTINASRAETAPQHTQIDLVPAGSGVTPGQQPITSAPVTANDGSMANPYARDDATALPQSDYSQLARRAQPAGPQNGLQLTDPRSITGRPDSMPAAPRTTHTPIVPVRSARTEPVAVYQPVPSIRVGGDATARLLLTVGADGRVKDIEIARAIDGDTARLIGAVQEWRFRPATENGVPVASRFSVDITFHGNE